MALHVVSTLAALGMVLGLDGPSVLGARQVPPVFRSGVDLVMLHVTVTDGAGHYVTDLDDDEFLVFEGGQRQKLEFVQKGGLPLAVSLLLDTSSSVEHAFSAVQHAASAFVRALDPMDLGSVIAFGDRVRVLHDFTSDRAALENAILEARPRGGTTLYNAIYIALKELDKTVADPVASIPRRRTAIILSDGDDTSSIIGFQEVLDFAALTDAVVYAIAFDRFQSGLGQPAEAEYVLRQLAKHTGGQAFFPSKRYELSRIYGQIRAELSSQYTLGYVSNDVRRDGRFRPVTVQVDRARARARTRRGYVSHSR